MMILLFVSVVVWAGEPTGYYNDAQGKTGEILKYALHDIIDNHKVISYNGLHSAYYDSDNLNGKVWDIYSHNPNGSQYYEYTLGSKKCGNYQGEGDCYNREHTFPQSWFGKKSPMVSDLVQVLPTDGYVNGRRSSFPYGEVKDPSWTSMNGSKLGPNTTAGYSGTVFEPIDEYKGDVARIYFYMATRYYGEDNSWPGSAMVNGAEPKAWAVDLLMKWHVQDPVSKKETDRNDAIHDNQNNRNPFVDHPEYACLIWGNGDCGDIVIEPDTTTTTVDPTADVTINMGSSDYQLIVDYVNTNLTNTDGHPDNTENYYGATSYHNNFDIRNDAYNAKFSSADAAIEEAIGDILLPAKVESSLLNVDYIVSYATWDGSNSGTGSKTFHCSATDPIAFTLGAATVDPVDTTSTDTTHVDPGDTTVVDPGDTTVVTPGDSQTSLSLTFDSGIAPCTMVQVSGATAWNHSSYNENGYAVINTHKQGANESWLVTPAVNMDALENESFTFRMTSYNYGKKISACGDGQFELYYSASYDGQSINKSDWIRITEVDDVMLGAEKWDWVDASVDVTAIAGDKVYFAFAHTSNATNGTTWELDDVVLKGDAVAAINDVSLSTLSLYPNPVSNSFYLPVAVDDLKVLNLSGKLMLQTSELNAATPVDVAALKSGVYLVRVQQGDDVEVLRLVKK